MDNYLLIVLSVALVIVRFAHQHTLVPLAQQDIFGHQLHQQHQ